MSCPTKSEKLFEAYCESRGYGFERVPTQAGRTPDFLVHTESGVVVAEVTEFRANEEDNMFATEQEQRRQGQASGSSKGYGAIIGKRLRGKIEDKLHQTKSASTGGRPCIVVVYDNIRHRGKPVHIPWTIDLDPDAFSVAMYGEVQLVMTLSNETGEILRTKNQVGGNRKLRPDQGMHISAICHLAEAPATGELFLISYHNAFAEVKLPTSIFCKGLDNHLRNPLTEDGFTIGWEVAEENQS